MQDGAGTEGRAPCDPALRVLHCRGAPSMTEFVFPPPFKLACLHQTRNQPTLRRDGRGNWVPWVLPQEVGAAVWAGPAPAPAGETRGDSGMAVQDPSLGVAENLQARWQAKVANRDLKNREPSASWGGGDAGGKKKQVKFLPGIFLHLIKIHV